MSAYSAVPWSDSAVAVVGAAAALTGLLFVAVSIDVELISATGSLALRALSTMLQFAVPLVVGILVLVPGRPATAPGTELAVVGEAAGAGLVWVNRPANRADVEPRAGWLLIRAAPTVTIPVCLLLAAPPWSRGRGAACTGSRPRSSRDSSAASLLGGLATVWVLLVEIRR